VVVARDLTRRPWATAPKSAFRVSCGIAENSYPASRAPWFTYGTGSVQKHVTIAPWVDLVRKFWRWRPRYPEIE
jgi:hypothetical protein